MDISIDKIEDGLPISVVVPLSEKRKDFFNYYVLPLIQANNPNEIIINYGSGTAPQKRNDGFLKATQPYIFFCDDDIVLPSNYLEILYNVLIEQPKNIGYAYTGYHGIVLDPSFHPIKRNFTIPSRPFSVDALKRGNYISTMSLMRKEVFPMFDTKLKRLQDWDIYLTLADLDISGVFIDDLTFLAFYIDEGITSNNNSEVDAIRAILDKHKIQ